MENQEFVLFQSFNTEDEAAYLKDLLIEEQIPFEIIPPNPNISSTIVRSEIDNLFTINLHPDNFQKVNNLLLEKSADSLWEIPEDYYLFQFSNEELMNVILHKEEWSSQDYLLAKKILADRGIQPDDKKLDEEIEARLKSERAPKKGKTIWMAIGLASAILGGFFGILLGWSYYAAKNTDSKGRTSYVYDEKTRSYGLAMMSVGTIALVVYAIWIVLKKSK